MATDEAAPAPPLARLVRHLSAPVDIASLAAFRIAFGAIMLFAVARFWAKGWIDELYIAPAMHFPYAGFEWVAPWPGVGMYVHFAALGALAAAVMVGFFTRTAAALFCVGFAYVELLDQTNYLNHYVLITLVAGLLAATPAGRAWSVDAWRRPGLARDRAPRWCSWALRFQLGVVYTFAGLAKLQADWLLDAEPLTIWLGARGDAWLIGDLVQQPWAGVVMSWAGAAFDLSVPWLLLVARTRPLAYAAVVLFHAMTALLFNIGMFPWVMIALTPIFFPPDWPRRLPRRPSLAPSRVEPGRSGRGGTLRGRLAAALLSVYALSQIVIPLRHFVYAGDVRWTEEGYLFAWQVMVVEKTGVVWFQVRDPATGQGWEVSPTPYLTPRQAQMVAFSPPMQHRFARWLAADFERRGHPGVEVRADGWAKLNRRPSQRLIRPEVDLARLPLGAPAERWIVPLEPRS